MSSRSLVLPAAFLARLEAARGALAECHTVQETKRLADVADAAEHFARKQRMSDECIGYAHALRIDALAALGRLLKETPKAQGARGAAGPGRGKRGARVGPRFSAPTLADLGLDKKQSSLAQRLAALPEETLSDVRAGNLAITAALDRVHVSHNSGADDWGTPQEYIEAARRAMGSIDCDPASSARANRRIRAQVFYDEKQNGLESPWHGNVWLNPPYAQPLVAQFALLAVAKLQRGEIKQACVMLNNGTETAFFQDLAKAASALCFPAGRIRFLNGAGERSGVPLQGQVVIYLGPRRARFTQSFSKLGVVVVPA